MAPVPLDAPACACAPMNTLSVASVLMEWPIAIESLNAVELLPIAIAPAATADALWPIAIELSARANANWPTAMDREPPA